MGGRSLSEDEWTVLRATLEARNWNITHAAEALGRPRKTISDQVAYARKRGWAASIEQAYVVKGESVLYDGDGIEKLRWVKTALDQEKLEAMAHEVVAALTTDIVPAKKIAAPTKVDAAIMVALQIGDAHIGSYSWGPECSGGSFDLDIAQNDLMVAAERLIDSLPNAEECFIANVGDWFHSDTSKPFTPLSGNLLDTDSRWPKVVSSGVKVQRAICEMALAKFKRVRLRNAKGNHDPHSSIILDVAMQAYFENNPRLVVEDTPRDMFWFTFGQNLMAVTHGHNVKLENLPGVLAVDAREEWGRCEFRHIWCGHFHAHKVLDIMGTRVTVWPTLAANDKWHSDKGYRSLKEMHAVVLHKDYGVIESHVASLKRIREAT